MMKKTTPRKYREGLDDASGELFDFLRKKRGLKNDAALGVYFGLHRSSVSRVRNGKGPVSLAMREAIMRKEGMSVAELDRLIKRPRFPTQEGAQ